MKFATVLAFIAAATVVSASTNAERLAYGLSPNAPANRGKPPSRPHKSYPSGKPSKPGMCDNGNIYCCNSVQKCGEGNEVDKLMALLNLDAPAGTSVGSNCSPITVIGAGGNSCTQQTVCCEDNHFNGLINIGCTPVNINF